NVTMAHLKSTGKETYEGRVEVEDLDLGQLFDNPDLGKSSFVLEMKGKGLERQTLNSIIEGKFSKFTFKGYTYNDLKINGQLKNPLFTGKIISRDPNLIASFSGSANIADKQNEYNFKAVIDRARLHTLNFVKNDSIASFKGSMIMKMRGHNINDAQGE